MKDNENMELMAGDGAGAAPVDGASELQGQEGVTPAEAAQTFEETAAEAYEAPQAEGFQSEPVAGTAQPVEFAQAPAADAAQVAGEHAEEAAAAAAGADTMYNPEGASEAEPETTEFQGLKHSFEDAAGKFTAAAQNENVQKAKNKITGTLELALVAVRRPIEAVNNVLFRGKQVEGLILGGLNLFILFLTNSIHLSVGDISSAFSVGSRLKMAFFMALIVALWIVMLAAGGFAFRRKDVHKLNFTKVLGAFCCITVPATLATVLVFLLGMVSGTLAMFVSMLACVVTFCFALILMYLIVDGTPDVKTWKTAGIFLVVSLVISILTLLMLTSMITAMMSSLFGNPYTYNLYG